MFTIMQKRGIKPRTAAKLSLRLLASASTSAAVWIVLTSKQSALVFGVKLEARYTYSSALRFFVYANVIGCAMSVLSLFALLFVLARKLNLRPGSYFVYMFLHDLVVMNLLMGANAAATAIGYVGRYGNSHSGWMAVCDNFSKFCNKLEISIILSFFSYFFYLCLVIISALSAPDI